MTGYGRGESLLHNRKFLIEIKSINHRYNDISVKIPRIMNVLEDIVRKKTAQRFQRGKADVFVTYESLSSDDIAIRADIALADAYVEQIRMLNLRYGLNQDITLEMISRIPDVIVFNKNCSEEKSLNEMREALEMALEEALERHTAMREAEGLMLQHDIAEKNALINKHLQSISERAPSVAHKNAERLKARVFEALDAAMVDHSRLAQEMAVMAERMCIDEEITRLSSHIHQLGEILGQDEPMGRKLDFLVQEMNREINTIGSKSGDLEITRHVVEMKGELEKIREQVQNIE